MTRPSRPLQNIGVIVLVGTLAACNASDETGSTNDGASDNDPQPYLVDDLTPETLDLSAEEAGEAIDSLLASVIDYKGSVVFDAYREIMAFADDTCPPVRSDGEAGGTLWDADCTASSGAYYSGFISVYEGKASGQQESAMHAEATVNTPAGDQFLVAGDVRTLGAAADQNWYSRVSAVVYYDGPAAEGTWMEATPDLSLEYYLGATSNGPVNSISLEGSIGSLEGSVTAIDLSGVQLSNTDKSPCSLEPAGRISVRDADGTWAEVEFDLVAEGEGTFSIDEGACDGCGTLWYDGQESGQVCVDTGPLFGVEVPLW